MSPNDRFLFFTAVGLCLLTLPVLAVSPSATPEGFQTLELGAPAPDFSLPGVDGKTYTLKDFAEPDVLMVYFTGTHCPVSHAVEDRLQALIDSLRDESFGIVAINPNHPDGLRGDEYGYSLYEETFADSKRYAEDLNWEFPYLYDGEKQLTARAYGCLATPHVFVFDRERTLRYKGRFDDSRFPDPSTVKHADAAAAVQALLEGRPVPVQETRPFGCSTKWRERSAHVAERAAIDAAVPVHLDTIDAAGITALRKNETGKLRLFNLWATWCAPCVQEFPDLVALQTRFGMRPFELITVSLDAPADREKVAAFLERQRAIIPKRLRKSVKEEGRIANHYLYTDADTDRLAEALDPDWKGPVPYSVLVDAQGNILYRCNGKLDPEFMKNKVIEILSDTY